MAIWICGVPRSGKTTYCKNFAKENKVSVISTEALRNGFQKMDKDNFAEWGRSTSEKRKKDFPVFLKEFVKWNEFFSEGQCIVDCALVELKTVYEFCEEGDQIICFGFGGNSLEDILSFIRQREGQNDYTKNFSDEKLIKLWGDVAEIDKQNFQFCKENKLKYMDCMKENSR